MKHSFRPVHRRHKHGGFTLVELMISLTIGLLIVGALITLLVNLNRNQNEFGKSNRMIENGRFALQLLEADLVHGGYWGGFVPRFDDLINTAVPTDVPTGIPDPCTAYGATWNTAYQTNLVGVPVHSYEVPAVVPNPAIPVCATAGVGPVLNARGNSDVVVVRYAQKCTTDCLAAAPAAVDRIYMQVQRCGTTIPVPGYLLAQTGFVLQNVRCTAPSEIRRFVSNIYYVSDVAGVPTLMRSQFGLVGGAPAFEPAQAMIDGVESVRIEYGLDTVSDSGGAVNFTQAITWASETILNSPTNRGDGIPDGAFVRCTSAVPCSSAQLMNAVAVRIHVLVRSDQSTPGYVDSKTYELGGITLGPFGDNFKRHVFTRTIRLTNVASRRETP